MKSKKIISIIIITALCLWKINSQVIVPNLSLSGTQTGNNEYKAVNIQSTQIINSGKTTYTAGNEILLNPGFEVKSSAEFEAIMEDDSLNHLVLMTYNIAKNKYKKNAKVIASVNPDVVAVQEIRGQQNFNTLKNETGLEGRMCVTIAGVYLWNYGIALMWKPSFGTPAIKKVEMSTSAADADSKRAYIIADFKDFYFISTHYSSAQEPTEDRIEMTNAILNEDVVKNYRKPIYIAGDLNESPHNGRAIALFRASGFEVLNDITRRYQYNYNGVYGEWYDDATRQGGAMIDLILEKNTNPKRKIIERGIPAAADTTFTISDHLPYYTKVKIK